MFATFRFLIALAIAFTMTACSTDARTVPGEVLGDGMSLSAKQIDEVYRLGATEIAHIARSGFDVPKHMLGVAPSFGTRGETLVSPEPVRYGVILRRFPVVNPAQVRFTAAHEVFHWLALEANVPSTEALADSGVSCFGSKEAKEFAKSDSRFIENVDCDELSRTLKRK